MKFQPREGHKERFFKEKNVWVFVPAQKDAETLEIADAEEFENPGNTDDFEYLRTAVSFQVKKDGNVATQFDPPIELRVGLEPDEVNLLREGVEIKLAFLLQEGDSWKEFKDHYGFKHDLAARDVIVWISDWGDATVGVGR